MREFIRIVEETDFVGKPDPYEQFVRDSALKLSNMVWQEATRLMEEARQRGLRPGEGNKFSIPDESDFINALIEQLQDAGF